jgi:hypothetical protein
MLWNICKNIWQIQKNCLSLHQQNIKTSNYETDRSLSKTRGERHPTITPAYCHYGLAHQASHSSNYRGCVQRISREYPNIEQDNRLQHTQNVE